MSTRIPTLGPRGEGWLVLQSLLFAAIAIAGFLAVQGRAVVIGPAECVGIVIMLAGLGVVLRAARDLGRSFSPLPKPVARNQLVQSGAFGWVRHPIYSGIVVAGLGWSLLSGSWLVVLFSLVLLGLFDAKSRREEAWLREDHPDYAAYAGRTKRFVPGVY